MMSWESQHDHRFHLLSCPPHYASAEIQCTSTATCAAVYPSDIQSAPLGVGMDDVVPVQLPSSLHRDANELYSNAVCLVELACIDCTKFTYGVKSKKYLTQCDRDGDVLLDTCTVYVTSSPKPLTCPPSWASLLNNITSGTVMVCGAKNTGKSTFTRMLTNSWLSHGVSYVDTDVGQGEFVPPGVMSVTAVTEPLLSPPVCHMARSSSVCCDMLCAMCSLFVMVLLHAETILRISENAYSH